MLDMRKLKYSILTFAFLGLVVSCDNEIEPTLEGTMGEQAAPTVPLNLKLEADVDFEAEGEDLEVMRNLSYKVGPNGTQRDVLPENKVLHSLCIISSADGSEKYYVSLDWKKVPRRNAFKMEKIDVKTQGGTGIARLNMAKKWYIKGYMTYNKANIKDKRVDYAPNGSGSLTLKPLSGNDAQQMDVPLYFDWTPLYLDPKHNGVEVQNTKALKAKVNNKSIVIRPFGSMARITLTNKEDYDVKIKGLSLRSTVATPSHGYVDLSTFSAPNATAQTITYKPASVSDAVAIGLADTPVVQAGQKYGKSYVLWLMPQTVPSGKKAGTHLLANVARQINGRDVEFPKMTSLYVWGSTSKKAPGKGKRFLLAAEVHRPKLGLEYVSKGYKQGRDRQPNFGPSGVTKFKFGEINSYVPAGYRNMTYADAYILGWHGLYYSQIGSVKSGHVNGWIAGEDYGADSRWQKVGSDVYALRFMSVKGNKQYTAWRYKSSGTPNKIECVYLGPNFKGDFEDIKKADFWMLHEGDIVSRDFNTTRVEIPRGETRSVRQKWSFESNAMTWIDGTAPTPQGGQVSGWLWHWHNTLETNEFLIAKHGSEGSRKGPILVSSGIVNVSAPLIMIQSDSNPDYREFNG